MAYTPKPAGPRNLRQLFHWVYRELKSVGVAIGEGGGAGAVWGAITGDIQDQTDLQAQFDTKVEEAPTDGQQYGRQNLNWTVVGGTINTGYISDATSDAIGTVGAAWNSYGDRLTVTRATNEIIYWNWPSTTDDLYRYVGSETAPPWTTTDGEWIAQGGGSVAWGAIIGDIQDQTDLQAQFDEYLLLTGGVLTGVLSMSGNAITNVLDPVLDQDAATKFYVDTEVSNVPLDNYVLKAGDTMTGALVMTANPITDVLDPVLDQDAATKIYVDDSILNENRFVLKIGDTMSGDLVVVADIFGVAGDFSSTVTALSYLGDGSTLDNIVEEAPIDGDLYARQNAAWAVISGLENVGWISDATSDLQPTISAAWNDYGDRNAIVRTGNEIFYFNWPSTTSDVYRYLGNQVGPVWTTTDEVWLNIGGASVAWGAITGDINDQTDLQNEFVNVTGDDMTGQLTITTNLPTALELISPDFDAARLVISNTDGGVGFYCESNGNGSIQQLSTFGVSEAYWIRMLKDSGVTLYWNAFQRLVTNTDGVDITGLLDVNGNITAEDIDATGNIQTTANMSAATIFSLENIFFSYNNDTSFGASMSGVNPKIAFDLSSYMLYLVSQNDIRFFLDGALQLSISTADIDAGSNNFVTTGQYLGDGSQLTGIVEEAPNDGNQYGRQSLGWTEITGGSGSAVWGDITGNINDQTDLQQNFVNVTGDDMTGRLTIDDGQGYIEIGGTTDGANIEMKGGTPFIDMAVSQNTDFDWRLTELSNVEFRIQSLSASAKLWAYNVKYVDVGLNTSNAERAFRVINSQGSVGFINNTGALRIAQMASGGVFQESWITAEKNSGVTLFFNGQGKLTTTTDGMFLQGDDTKGGIRFQETNRNYNADVYVMDWFQAGAPILVMASTELSGSAWIQTTQPGGTVNTYNFTNIGQLALPAAPNANTSATTKLYVDQQTSDRRFKTKVLPIDEPSILDLNVYEYEFIEHERLNTTAPKFRAGRHFGVIADEVEAIVPDAVLPMPGNEEGEDFQAVDDQAVLYLLLEEVKKLRARIEELENA